MIYPTPDCPDAAFAAAAEFHRKALQWNAFEQAWGPAAAPECRAARDAAYRAYDAIMEYAYALAGFTRWTPNAAIRAAAAGFDFDDAFQNAIAARLEAINDADADRAYERMVYADAARANAE